MYSIAYLMQEKFCNIFLDPCFWINETVRLLYKNRPRPAGRKIESKNPLTVMDLRYKNLFRPIT